jgi:predicted N-acyltransferase
MTAPSPGPQTPKYRSRSLASIDEVSPLEWNDLLGNDALLLRHEFLAALEHQACVGERSGWTPCHFVLTDLRGRLRAALPLYRKLHSWGEFVFDFAWAQAYARSGLEYYPKLVAAVPFTPATGPRLLATPGPDQDLWRRELARSAVAWAREEHASSLHMLFLEKEQAEKLRPEGFLLRRDCQFHWHNHDYRTFEDFLARFTAPKRKKIHRERRRVTDAGIRFRTLHGGEIDRSLWQTLYGFHADTFLRHGHTPYLSQGFFLELAERLPHHVVVQLAVHRSSPVAAAICFRGDSTLYGRYWGAARDFHSLHFETCYHQGIEYCIRERLSRFEPGTQGEHKVSRGFEPTLTWSAHWIAHPQFARAIAEYLRREGEAIEGYAAEVDEHVPYRRSVKAGVAERET